MPGVSVPHLMQAFDDYVPHLIAWLIVMVVAVMTTVLTCGLGIILLPNLLRIAKTSLETGAPPEVGMLFDLSDVVEHLLLLVVSAVGALLSSAIPVVGALLVGTLFLWVTPLVIDGQYGTFQAVMVSIRGVLANPVPAFLFQLVVTVIGVLSGMCLGVPLLFTGPILLLATWHYYQAERATLLALGDEAGVGRRA